MKSIRWARIYKEGCFGLREGQRHGSREDGFGVGEGDRITLFGREHAVDVVLRLEISPSSSYPSSIFSAVLARDRSPFMPFPFPVGEKCYISRGNQKRPVFTDDVC